MIREYCEKTNYHKTIKKKRKENDQKHYLNKYDELIICTIYIDRELK